MEIPQDSTDVIEQSYKKVYVPPSLTEYGSIADLTLGDTGVDFDVIRYGI